MAAPPAFGFWIHVTPRSRRPRSRRPQLGGLHADALRVAVHAARARGKANADCVAALVGAFGDPRDRVALAPGSRHRRKRVRILENDSELERRFAELAASR